MTNRKEPSGWFLRRLYHPEFSIIDIPKSGCIEICRNQSKSCIALPVSHFRHVSRTHCRLEIINNRVIITDTESATGTYVNDRELSKLSPGSIELEEADLLGVGVKTELDPEYYTAHRNALLFRICRRRNRNTEAAPIVLSSDDDSDATEATSLPAPVQMEISDESDNIDKNLAASAPRKSSVFEDRSVCVAIHDRIDSTSSGKTDHFVDIVLQKGYESDTGARSDEDDAIMLISDDEDFSERHYSQLLLQSIKKETIDEVMLEDQQELDDQQVLEDRGEVQEDEQSGFSNLRKDSDLRMSQSVPTSGTVSPPLEAPEVVPPVEVMPPAEVVPPAVPSAGISVDSTDRPLSSATMVRRKSICLLDEPEPQRAKRSKSSISKRRASVATFSSFDDMINKRRLSVSSKPPQTSQTQANKEERAKKLRELTVKDAAKKAAEDIANRKAKPVGIVTGVKFTPHNRGQFLTDLEVPRPARRPSVSRPAAGEESIVCTQTTELHSLHKDIDDSSLYAPAQKLSFRNVTYTSTSATKIPSAGTGGTGCKPSTSNSVRTTSSGGNSASVSSTSAYSSRQSNSARARPSTSTTHRTSVSLKPLLKKSNLYREPDDRTAQTERRTTVRFASEPQVRTVSRYILPEPLPWKQLMSIMKDQEMVEVSTIISWNADWLTAASEPQMDTPLVPMEAERYSTLDVFRTTLRPILQLELKHDLWAQYKEQTDPAIWQVSIQCIKPLKQRVKQLICEMYTDSTIANTFLTASEIGILQYTTFCGQQSRCFVYMASNARPIGNGSDRLGESAMQRSARYSCLLYIASDTTIDETVAQWGPINYQSITVLSPHMRQLVALALLRYSPLLQNVLSPAHHQDVLVAPGKGFADQPQQRDVIMARIAPQTLNEQQMQIMLSILDECSQITRSSISLIQGPPGTGKSRLISQLAVELWRLDPYANNASEASAETKKVLICAQSNTAVDVIASKLYQLQKGIASEKRYKVVRIGSPDKIDHHCRDIYLDVLLCHYILDNCSRAAATRDLADMQQLKQALRLDSKFKDVPVKEVRRRVGSLKGVERTIVQKIRSRILQEADIVCTTLGSCGTLCAIASDVSFHFCIIDEATQCTEVCSLLPLQYGMSKLILVGDIRQLPATVLARESADAGFRQSLFARLHRCYSSSGARETGVKELMVQYRMHPEICKWPNEYFYNGSLISDPITTALYRRLPLIPYLVVSLDYDQNLTQVPHHVYNYDEMMVVVQLLRKNTAVWFSLLDDAEQRKLLHVPEDFGTDAKALVDSVFEKLLVIGPKPTGDTGSANLPPLLQPRH
ncbi:probable helicase senataxin isoform X2 [Anopheles albimanus]|uniref:probable helicase senataxin isoform X2 n=1 Tax=Anopheles albimanus TaxID=7167 RepID=UPI001641B728|nr:probable helicase senataxin isoform X2 [Anopheles albimanus]